MRQPSGYAERLTALAVALGRASRRSSLAGEAAGALALAAAAVGGALERVPYGAPGRLVAGAVLFLVIATAAKTQLLRGDVRAALEAFSWIGRWEWLRARAEIADPFPASIAAAQTYAEAHDPTPHAAWVEILAFAGEPERARELAGRLPAETPWERFEREAVRAYLGWLETGRNDDSAARRALGEIGDAEERLRAEATLALGEARAALGKASDEWAAPLVRVRERLGSRADGILRHEWWRAQVLAGVSYAVSASIAAEVVPRLV